MKKLFLGAFGALALTACMDRSTEAPAAEESATPSAARPLAYADGIKMRRIGQEVITYSFQGTYPSILPELMTLATRSWTSLANPEASTNYVFKRVADNTSAKIRIVFTNTSSLYPSGYLWRTKPTVQGSYYSVPDMDINFYAVSTVSSAQTYDWNRPTFLYRHLLHELGHALGLADETESVYAGNVMYNPIQDGRSVVNGVPTYSELAIPRGFGTDDVATINTLYNAGMENPFVALFTRPDAEGEDRYPVLGWDAARVSASQGVPVTLRGLVLRMTANGGGNTKVVNLFRNGTYWDDYLPSSIASGMPAECKENPVSTDYGVAQFQTRTVSTMSPIQKVSSVYNYSTGYGAPYLLNFDSPAPGWSCQKGLGWYYNLNAR